MSAPRRTRTVAKPAGKDVTTFTVTILENNRQPASRKLADAKIHFVGGELNGLTLAGFALWADVTGTGESVTFSTRQFSVSGQRRPFSLGRWIAKREAQDRMADVVIRAYRRHRLRVVAEGLK